MILINKLITIFPILFYPFANMAILFILGFGLTFLILPKTLRRFWLWLSPWTAIIFSIFMLVIGSLLGLSVAQSFWPLIIVFLTIDLYVIIKIKPRISFNIKEDFLLSGFVLMTLIFNLSPLIKHDKLMTVVSLGNNDVISYSTAGDYLKNNSISESFKVKTEQSTGVLLNYGYRWGTPIINSFFLKIFNFQAYQYSYIAQVILFSLAIPLSYILFRILYKSNLLGLLLISILTALNVNLLYILYHDFFGQVLFWGIEFLLFIFFYSYFDSIEIKKEKINKYDFIIGILITVLYFSYHEPAIFMFTPIGVYLLVTLFLKKNNFKYYLKALVRISCISLVLGATSIAHAFIIDFQQAFMGNPNQPIGWQLFRSKIPYANPFEAMGFWSIHNFEPIVTPLAIILSIIVVLIIVYGLIKSHHKTLSLSYIIIFLFFYYWTGLSKNDFFAFNRALTYTLPFMITLFCIGLTSLYEKNKRFWIIAIFILIGLEFWSSINLNKRFIREHLSVEKSYISIFELKNQNIKEPIYIESMIKDSTPLWKQNWIGYFLYSSGISVVPTEFNSNEFENAVPNESLLLMSKPAQWFSSLRIIYKDIIWSNKYFNLGHICNSKECLIKSKYLLNDIKIGSNEFEDSLLINGWSITEGDTRWANAKESTLRLVAKDIYPTKLTVEALSLNSPQEMTIYLNEELLGKISIDKEWKIYSLPINYQLNPGVQKIKFVYSNGYRPMDVIPGNLDNRTLYVNFKEIKLE